MGQGVNTECQLDDDQLARCFDYQAFDEFDYRRGVASRVISMLEDDYPRGFNDGKRAGIVRLLKRTIEAEKSSTMPKPDTKE